MCSRRDCRGFRAGSSAARALVLAHRGKSEEATGPRRPDWKLVLRCARALILRSRSTRSSFLRVAADPAAAIDLRVVARREPLSATRSGSEDDHGNGRNELQVSGLREEVSVLKQVRDSTPVQSRLDEHRWSQTSHTRRPCRGDTRVEQANAGASSYSVFRGDQATRLRAPPPWLPLRAPGRYDTTGRRSCATFPCEPAIKRRRLPRRCDRHHHGALGASIPRLEDGRHRAPGDVLRGLNRNPERMRGLWALADGSRQREARGQELQQHCAPRAAAFSLRRQLARRSLPPSSARTTAAVWRGPRPPRAICSRATMDVGELQPRCRPAVASRRRGARWPGPPPGRG